MLLRRLFGHYLPCLAICAVVAIAAVPGDDATPDGSKWLETIWNLPMVRHFMMPQPDLPTRIAQPAANCNVEPLPEMVDAEAVQFEREEGPDTGGLLPAMAQAMEKFRKLITSAGGSFELKSAYRPVAYQEHLRQVWFKWMRELRRNREPGCQVLRAEVGEEFTRHKLMETQMPVTDSDHTRGMAFDAAVMMPRLAQTRKKRRVSLDRLALLAGLRRPDIRRDPVHFKLVITASTLRAQSE